MELDTSAVLGENVRTCLDLDDNIIELDLTPNRGDCFSVLGIAREVCANYDLSLFIQNYKAKQKGIKSTNSENIHYKKYLHSKIPESHYTIHQFFHDTGFEKALALYPSWPCSMPFIRSCPCTLETYTFIEFFPVFTTLKRNFPSSNKMIIPFENIEKI